MRFSADCSSRAALVRFVVIVLAAALTSTLFPSTVRTKAETIRVLYTEGVTHGFLLMRDEAGAVIADGELRQVARGALVTSHLFFWFKDGSSYDEVTVFSQRGVFRLVSDIVHQEGPAFKHPGETKVDAKTGTLTTRAEGKDKATTKQMKLPVDLANGMTSTLLKNLPEGATHTSFTMVSGSSPRLVTLNVSEESESTVVLGGVRRRAKIYLIKFEIQGVAGVVAPLVGKKTPDVRVWILRGEAPVFIASEGPLEEGGQICRIELARPELERSSPGSSNPEK